MTATDLDALHPSDDARWVTSADPAAEIFDHGRPRLVELLAQRAGSAWWSGHGPVRRQRGLPGGPVTGLSAGSGVGDSGRQVITRGHVFSLAAGVADDPDAALRLLWHALAWGSGLKYRLDHQRMDSIADDLPGTSEALAAAARLSRVLPVEAYRRLYPGDRTLIGSLGPAFLPAPPFRSLA